jgi:hypothetical protein
MIVCITLKTLMAFDTSNVATIPSDDEMVMSPQTIIRLIKDGHDIELFDPRAVDMVGTINDHPNIPNDLGNTALIIASWKGYDQVVELLINCGADPLLRNKNGSTALSTGDKTNKKLMFLLKPSSVYWFW